MRLNTALIPSLSERSTPQANPTDLRELRHSGAVKKGVALKTKLRSRHPSQAFREQEPGVGSRPWTRRIIAGDSGPDRTVRDPQPNEAFPFSISSISVEQLLKERFLPLLVPVLMAVPIWLSVAPIVTLIIMRL